MTDSPQSARWSPYVVGLGLGVLSWMTFGLMDQALGVSTTFVRVVGLIEGALSPAHLEQNAYLKKYVLDDSAVDWQMMLVLGLLIGSLVSALLGRSGRVERVPALWAWRYGPRAGVRYLAAFVGGVLVLYGARLAGGCTSGHGISGALQLAVGSWVFFVSLLAVGIAAAFLLYGKEGRRHV